MAQPTLTPLPPAEAVAALTRRGARLDPTFSWQDAWEAEHAAMFTVARSAGFDILKDIHDGLVQALAEGRTFQDFAKDLRPLLQKKGWWGRQQVTDPTTGEIQERTLGSTRRLRTIFETNMRVSYAAGHWAKFERTKATRPVLRYVSLLYGKDRRKQHVARHNLCLPVDDPYWDTWAPPCGWGCQCTLQSLSLRDVERMKGELKFTPPAETYRTFTNRRTGQVTRVPDGIDPGWAYNPGKVGHRATIVPDTEADVIRKLIDTKGTPGGGDKITPPDPPRDVVPPPVPDRVPPPKVYPAVDRSKTRPVHPEMVGGLEDGDYVFSHLKKYPEGITVGDFVRTHPGGEKAARRTLMTDYRAGRLVFERTVVAGAGQPPKRRDDKRITEARDWHRVSFRTDDVELSRMIALAPPVQRIEPIAAKGAYAQGVRIHMDGYETRAETEQARATWRHEFGHHLDRAAGVGTPWTWASSSPASAKAMGRDFGVMRANLSRTRHVDLADALRGRSDEQIDAALKDAGVGLTCADIRTIVRPPYVADVAGALIAKDARAYLKVTRARHASDVSAVALGFTSDAIEAVSQATIGGQGEDLVGHGAAYYRRFQATGGGYTEGNGAEAFANYIALRGSTGTAAHYRVYRHFLTSTAEAFDVIVRHFG